MFDGRIRIYNNLELLYGISIPAREAVSVVASAP
jgi:hypothetical protein